MLWSKKWQLQLAPDKCLQASIKTTGNSTTPNKYTIRSRPISFLDNIRDLGVLIDSKLTFKAHINNIIHKAFIRLSLKCFRSRDKRILTRAYCTYVRPILEYCSPVWSPHNKQLITRSNMSKGFSQGPFQDCELYLTGADFRNSDSRHSNTDASSTIYVTKYYTNSFTAPSPNFLFSCYLAHVVISSAYVKKNAPPLTGSISSSIPSWNPGTLCPRYYQLHNP